jgi:hypothetical protein
MAVMRFAAAIFFVLTLVFLAMPARADINQVEAREVARNNNCTPSKIAVYQQSLGSEGTTIYKVDCNLPKTDDANAPKTANALLISCRDSLCELLRPMEAESK